MPENNLKQADVIEGATVLPNPNGSAPGQWIETLYSGYRKLIMLIPGPPDECKPLFDDECLPRLRDALPARYIAKRILKAAMIPESQADKLLRADLHANTPTLRPPSLPTPAIFSSRCSVPKAIRNWPSSASRNSPTRMEEALDDWLYSSEGESLEQIVLYYLGLRQATLAVAESCTGGMIAQRITSVPGSSRSFLGGAVVYSNEMKTSFADVPPDLIARHGAVSSEVATALAEGIRKRTGASLGLGVTGIAGPAGATDTKPVGRVYIAVSDGQTTDTFERNFRGARDRVRDWATQQALDLIRRKLM